MGRFRICETPLSGLRVVERQVIGDSRGFLSRLFCAEELVSAGWRKPVVQINQTFTGKLGTVRGMHFQKPPQAEMKLVSCLHGAVWDVSVDLRARSPSFLHWHAEELSAENRRAMVIPEGFAHGFQSMTDDCELIYFHTALYAADCEGGLNPNDARLGIAWPHEITELSARDKGHCMLPPDFSGLVM